MPAEGYQIWLRVSDGLWERDLEGGVKSSHKAALRRSLRMKHAGLVTMCLPVGECPGRRAHVNGYGGASGFGGTPKPRFVKGRPSIRASHSSGAGEGWRDLRSIQLTVALESFDDRVSKCNDLLVKNGLRPIAVTGDA